MIKTKYNSIYRRENQPSRHGSNIENYLETEINYLLNPSADSFTQTEFYKIYVHNPEAEDALSPYLHHTQSNNTFILTGLTGSGKSMLIRYVFDIHSIVPHISNDQRSIIIPFNFNNIPGNDIRLQFQRMIHSACDCLYENFSGLCRAEDDEDVFFEFVKKRRSDLLYTGDIYPQPSRHEMLVNICNKMPLAFYSSIFKYYLSQREFCKIDNVIFVLDDIEGIRIDDMNNIDDRRQAELIPIKMVLELITCMQNQNDEVTEWSLNTIISCRHYVYRLMHSVIHNVDRLYSQALEAYSPSSRYDLKKSPSIMEIINKRFEAVPAQEREDKVTWKNAMDVVRELLERIDEEVCPFVLELKLNNIREALSCLKELIFNKRWIQRECPKNVSGAFKIGDISQYKPTYASLIRAIGMNESVVYNSNNSLIPNLLYNGERGELNLYPLLALKYALKVANFEESSWDDLPIRIYSFYREIELTFGEKVIVEYFQSSVRYLIENRLLLRSADQEQIDNDRLSRNNIDKVECVYVPGVAATLWRMLGQNSVLLEMYIDDLWLDNSKRRLTPRYSRGFIDDKFEVCLDYIETLMTAEQNIFSLSYNFCGSERYYNLFGQDSLCAHLLSGLNNSLNIFFRDDRGLTPRERDRLKAWYNRVDSMSVEASAILGV